MLALLAILACEPGDGDGKGGDDPVTTIDGEPIPPAGHDSGEPPLDPDERSENLASGAGDFAADYLKADPYPSLVVEVDYVAGSGPDAAALDDLKAFLADLLNKPGGIEIVVDDEIPSQGAPAWSTAAAQDLEVAWRDRYRDPSTGTAVMYFLYVDGHSDQDSDSGRILGFAYHGSSLVMFGDTMADVGGGLLGLGAVEPTVLQHEAGHVLGLVNNGAPMVQDHEDPDHRHHDADDGCLMYWAVETDAIAELLGSGTPTLDAACRADLKAAGGR